MDIKIEKNAHTNLRITLIIIGVSLILIACFFTFTLYSQAKIRY